MNNKKDAGCRCREYLIEILFRVVGRRCRRWLARWHWRRWLPHCGRWLPAPLAPLAAAAEAGVLWAAGRQASRRETYEHQEIQYYRTGSRQCHFVVGGQMKSCLLALAHLLPPCTHSLPPLAGCRWLLLRCRRWLASSLPQLAGRRWLLLCRRWLASYRRPIRITHNKNLPIRAVAHALAGRTSTASSHARFLSVEWLGRDIGVSVAAPPRPL